MHQLQLSIFYIIKKAFWVSRFKSVNHLKIGSKPALHRIVGKGAGSMLSKFRDIWTIFHGGDTLRAPLQVLERNLNFV